MSNIEKAAKDLNNYILEQEIVKEFKLYDKKIKENKELRELEEKIKLLQKQIVNQKAKQDSSVSETIAIYQQLKAQFDEHPLVVNYLYLKNEVDQLLQEINQRINLELSMKRVD